MLNTTAAIMVVIVAVAIDLLRKLFLLAAMPAN